MSGQTQSRTGRVGHVGGRELLAFSPTQPYALLPLAFSDLSFYNKPKPTKQTAFMRPAGRTYKSCGLGRRPRGPLTAGSRLEAHMTPCSCSWHPRKEEQAPRAAGPVLTLGRQCQRTAVCGETQPVWYWCKSKG